MSSATELNGVQLEKWLRFREIVQNDARPAERNPTVRAHWVGGQRSRVEFTNPTTKANIVTHIGGEGDLNPMQTLLAALAACDVDLIALHASLLGIEIESLSVEATGHFNVRSYVGVSGAPGSGYDSITYAVHLRAPNATPEQLAYLRECIERSSPVGDSLGRAIPLEFELIFENH